MNTTVTQPNAEVDPSVPRTPEPSKKEAVLVAWLAFLITGGGLLALYYARIGYLPDIEWHFTLVYVAVVSFIGGAYGLVQSLAIFLPGYIWCEAIICDSHIRKELCHVEPDKHAPYVLRHEPSISWVFRYIGSPFLFCLVVSHIILPLVVPISFPWGRCFTHWLRLSLLESARDTCGIGSPACYIK